MVRALRRSGLVLGLPALVGVSTLLHWLAGRRLTGLWIMPDEAVYAERALDLWRHGRLAVLHGEGAGYGVLYPVLAGLPLSVGRLATGYALLKLLQALVMSLTAVPIFFYGRRFMRPGYALLAATLAVAYPLTLYSGMVMTEALIYPLGALALLAVAKAVETTTLRDQLIALAAIAAAILTRTQAVVLIAVFAAAIIVDALLSRSRRSIRAFWPVWGLLGFAALLIVALPGVFGAYAGTLRGSYPLESSVALTAEHLSFLVLSTAIAPAFALAVLLTGAIRSDERSPPARAVSSVTACATVLVVTQVGFFAARYAPHLLGRDLAVLPPLLFTVFALWLDRGAPRPRTTVFFVALSLLALLLLTPWHNLVELNALPDTFSLAILFNLGQDNAELAVAGFSLVALAAIVALRGRLVLALPALMIALLVTSSVIASNNITDRVNYDQRNLVGVPPDWISHVTDAPTAYLYDGESYWNGVWQVRFWNQNVTDVVAVSPSRVPGPMPQRVVRVPATGLLPIRERYLVASDPHSFDGTPVAHISQLGVDTSGLTLWRLNEPARLTTIETGVQGNGDMTEPGLLTAFDCAGGRLEVTLLPKETKVVTLRLDGRVTTRARIASLPYWNGTIFVPPSTTARVCHFEIDGQYLLGSTRIVFVPR